MATDIISTCEYYFRAIFKCSFVNSPNDLTTALINTMRTKNKNDAIDVSGIHYTIMSCRAQPGQHLSSVMTEYNYTSGFVDGSLVFVKTVSLLFYKKCSSVAFLIKKRHLQVSRRKWTTMLEFLF